MSVVGAMVRPTSFSRLFEVFKRRPWIGFASIVGLLFPGRPAAIAGFVVSVVVDAIKRQTAGAFAHIGKKIVERKPPLANGNATRAIPLELSGFRIEAALLHMRPGIVSRRWPCFVRWRMTMTDLRLPFTLKTTATCRVTAREIVADCCDFGAAVTTAKPSRVSRLRMREADNGQPTETSPREILESAHVRFQ